MATMLLAAAFGVLTGWLFALILALLAYRHCRQFGLLADRLVAEQRIEAATRATLRAMRDAVWQQGHGMPPRAPSLPQQPLGGPLPRDEVRRP